MLSEPFVLMLLPALLIFTGMVIGFVLWSWARGIDEQVVEDLNDQIRSLRNKIQNEMYFDTGIEQEAYLTLQTENESLRTEMNGLRQDYQSCLTELNELKSCIKMLESDLDRSEATVRSLRDLVPQQAVSPVKLSDMMPQLQIHVPQLSLSAADSIIKNVKEPVLVESEGFEELVNERGLDLEYGGRVERDDALGLVYIDPPMIRDNLQLISGIASKLEQQLNQFGVYSFQQIGLWTESNIDQFSNLLDTFKDRIERDDWVSQANRLYQKGREMRRAA